MAVEITEAQIGKIVEQVLKNMPGATSSTDAAKPDWDGTQYHGRTFIGIFTDMNAAIEATQEGYKKLHDMTVAQREKIITEIRRLTRAEAHIMAELGVAETGMGRVEHKTAKHILVADKTPGTEDICPTVRTGDDGLTLVEMAPFGLVGSITPSTNPSETVICNSIGMIAAGNGVVFNPHPHAIATSNYAVDDTADIPKAGKDIIDGCSFDNNLPCIAEKEVFAFDNIADELIHYMRQNGAYMLSREQMDALEKIVLVEQTGKDGKTRKTINRKCVGRDAAVLMDKIGVKVDSSVRCLICEAEFNHPFVQTELMMPILPIVRVHDIDEAIDLAVKAEHGCRHTAHMHSKNVDHLTRFARAVETTIFVKNAPSYAGIGFGGEGHTTFTIAGPTGEGITSARSFTRQRRCVMADSFHII